MPIKPCLNPHCGEPATYRGRCPIHSKDRERQTHSNPGRIYSQKRWLTTRKRQLFNEPLCQECGAIATDVDHIVPISEGGDKWAESNLQSLCTRCHSAKTNREIRSR